MSRTIVFVSGRSFLQRLFSYSVESAGEYAPTGEYDRKSKRTILLSILCSSAVSTQVRTLRCNITRWPSPSDTQ